MNKKPSTLHAVAAPALDAQQAEEIKTAAALAAFARRYALPTRALSHACGGPSCGVSKSTADRIMRGAAGIRLTSERRRAVVNHLRDFLSRRGLTADAITAEISTIFPEEVAEVENGDEEECPIPLGTHAEASEELACVRIRFVETHAILERVIERFGAGACDAQRLYVALAAFVYARAERDIALWRVAITSGEFDLAALLEKTKEEETENEFIN